MKSPISVLSAALLLHLPLAGAEPATNDTQVFHVFGSNVPIDGSTSTLNRHRGGVSIHARTNELPAGAYTNWFVIFNNPSYCLSIPCSGADLPANGGDPAVQVSVLFATGNVVSDHGSGQFAASLKENDKAGALFGPGLLDAGTAEVHYIIRYHGPVIPAEMPAQIHEVGGGCGVMGNICEDLQASIHVP